VAHRLVTGPTVEPLTAAELKDQSRISHGEEDVLLERLIAAARSHVEKITRRALITQTWQLTLDRFPCHAVIYVPRPPLIAVSSITYLDEDGTEQTVDSDDYRVDDQSQPGRIEPAYGESWPTTRDTINAVEVTHTAGYGATAADVPEDLRHAIALLAGHYYEHREAALAGNLTEIPSGVDALCDSYILEAYG
jgi:uncharacterized phiE125 gp8 family phage protein